jgi:hypothetical protein
MKPLHLLIVIMWAVPVLGGVGDPTLQTDHPQYAGEGAFQTVEDCVQFAGAGRGGEQDRALAMFSWLLTHQWHLASPQEWNVSGRVPDTKRTDYDMIVYDANRARFSYSYGLCGTVHAWNETYWRAMKMRSRRRAFPGHTNSEIEYGGSWHTFDTDMAGLVFRPDGVVAGYADIIKNPSIVKQTGNGVPCYAFAWPSDFNGMKKGWQQVSKSPTKWYKMYNAGYSAHPGIVHLRRGETFTRYFDRDHFGGTDKRRFWHHMPGGPFRDWTFANQEEKPHHNGAKTNAKGNASYCNAEFIYVPDLNSDAYREGVVHQTANVTRSSKSPKLGTQDAKAGSIEFEHFGPYVIAGDPADNANPMTANASGGLVISGTVVGKVTLSVSPDQGQSWQKVGILSGAFRKDLTNQVKGRYGWRVRFELKEGAGLDAVRFATVCQVSQSFYPRLKSGGSVVHYRSPSRGVVPVLPDFGRSVDGAATYEVKTMRSTNIDFAPRTKSRRKPFETTNNKPGQVVFRIDSPRPLVQVNAAARYAVRVPSPKGCDFHLEISTDEGKTWKMFAKADVPADNEYSSGWVYGKADVSKANVKSALVRVHLYAGGYKTGMIDGKFYGLYDAEKSGPLSVTYGWSEDGANKEHTEAIKAGTTEKKFNVGTGPKMTDRFVRMTAQ